MDNTYMVSIQKAIQLVDTYTTTSKKMTSSLLNALDSFLAENVYSPINMPPFHQSAMDGYAVLYDDKHLNNFILVDEIKAGDNNQKILKPGEAVRIFTGAPTPINANAVIMQEKTSVKENILEINDVLSPFKNIRLTGEQIQEKELALAKGSQLNPAAIGFLATLGITEVLVYKKPTIAIVVTGNELVVPGNLLEFGQIYESNAIMLQTALLKNRFADITISKVKDNYIDTKNSLEQAIDKNDFVLISGGISVGDYDFVGKALLELNTHQVFYKIKQKPGKPLFFGTNNNTTIFALPGNPASALTCFYIYIETALQKFIGNPKYQKQTIQLKLEEEYIKKGIRGEFLKAKINGDSVKILSNQSSAMLNTFAEANALVYLEEGLETFSKNKPVTTYIID